MWNQTDSRDVKTNPVRPVQGPAPGERRGEGPEVRTPNLGRSIVIKGDITGSEDLAIDGQVEGKIDLPDHVLTIGPNAAVQADIKARVVLIFGTVVGNVTAREKAEVRVGGTLDGYLSAPTLVIQDGARLGAKVDMPKTPRAVANPPAALATVA